MPRDAPAPSAGSPNCARAVEKCRPNPVAPPRRCRDIIDRRCAIVAESGALAPQMHQQQRDRGRRHAGDARRLTHGGRPMRGELLQHLR